MYEGKLKSSEKVYEQLIMHKKVLLNALKIYELIRGESAGNQVNFVIVVS